MRLLDRNGNPTLTVLSQASTGKLETVYNIKVEDFSTYHIGEWGIWVHNTDCCDFTKQYGNLTKKWEGKWIDKNGKVIYLDPIDGKLKKFPDDARPSVDHVLPRNYIKEHMKGFKSLPRDIQEELLNHPENLQPMPKNLNSSKGNKVQFINGGWKTTKYNGEKIDVNKDYKIYLERQQLKMQELINNRINQFNGGK